MKKLGVLVLTLFLITSCVNKVEDGDYTVDPTSEMAQQVGDSMASIDESGGETSGAISYINITGDEKAFARMTDSNQTVSQKISSLLLPEAQAANCSTMLFSTCGSSQRIRTFSGCTVGTGGSISGTVALQYSNTSSNCTMPTNGNSVTRTPNFTITGLRGATYAVNAVSSSGQTLTRVSGGSFNFENAGIRRKFTGASGTVYMDVTTTTNGPILVSGTVRNNRSLSAGSGIGVVVTDNLTSVSCTVIPAGVTWTTGCNCPTSGSWSGSCTDASSFTMAFNNVCGDVSVVRGSEVKAVTLDRCQP